VRAHPSDTSPSHARRTNRGHSCTSKWCRTGEPSAGGTTTERRAVSAPQGPQLQGSGAGPGDPLPNPRITFRPVHGPEGVSYRVAFCPCSGLPGPGNRQAPPVAGLFADGETQTRTRDTTIFRTIRDPRRPESTGALTRAGLRARCRGGPLRSRRSASRRPRRPALPPPIARSPPDQGVPRGRPAPR
jgi:hypothetical protein